MCCLLTTIFPCPAEPEGRTLKIRRNQSGEYHPAAPAWDPLPPVLAPLFASPASTGTLAMMAPRRSYPLLAPPWPFPRSESPTPTPPKSKRSKIHRNTTNPPPGTASLPQSSGPMRRTISIAGEEESQSRRGNGESNHGYEWGESSGVLASGGRGGGSADGRGRSVGRPALALGRACERDRAGGGRICESRSGYHEREDVR